MSPPINTPDGSEVSEIVLPDGSTASEVIDPDGNVVFEAGADIPDYSVDHRYLSEDFASPWPDESGGANMTVNGLSTSSFVDESVSVSSDANDEYGVMPITNYPALSSFSFAITFQTTDTGILFGKSGSGGNFDACSIFQFEVLNDGVLEFSMRANNCNKESIDSNGVTVNDGNTHLAVLNVPNLSASSFELYIDDMSTDVSSVTSSQGYNLGDNGFPSDMYLFANNNEGSVEEPINGHMGVFESRSTVYSQNERDSLASLRPEI